MQLAVPSGLAVAVRMMGVVCCALGTRRWLSLVLAWTDAGTRVSLCW